MSDEAAVRRHGSKRYGDKIRRVLSAIRGHKRRHRVSDTQPETENVDRHDSAHRYSIRVAPKKSRSNSAILAVTSHPTNRQEDINDLTNDLSDFSTDFSTGRRVTGKKINLYLPGSDGDKENSHLTAPDDLISLERGLGRDMVVSSREDDISESSKHGHASSRRQSTLSNPDLLKPRNRRPLVDVSDTCDERSAIEAVRNSRPRTRNSQLPVTWACNDLRMDPHQLKLTPFRLGEGSYAKVVLGHYKGHRVAVKRILRQSRHDLEQELRMMHYLEDLDCTPQLVACDLSQEPFTVLTSYHGKSIFDCMGDSSLNKQLDWSQILYDTISALCSIHERGIVHGDVKEDNVLLDRLQNRIKPIIIDFGLACFRDQARPMNIGPTEKDKRRFMEKYPRVAPELVHHNLPIDYSTDAYAVGYMIQRVLRYVKVKRPAKYHKVAQKLLEKDPIYRISLHEALRMLQ